MQANKQSSKQAYMTAVNDPLAWGLPKLTPKKYTLNTSIVIDKVKIFIHQMLLLNSSHGY